MPSGRRVLAVVALGTVLGNLATAGLAYAAPLGGRFYDGNQTRSGAGESQLAFDWQVSANGHQIRHLYLNYVTFNCPGGAAADLLMPGDRTVSIAGDGKFKIALPAKDAFSPSPDNGSVVLSGQFGGSGGEVSGKFAFTGSGPLVGCHKKVAWNGKVRPRVDLFTGKVKEGSHHASISFSRTSEPHPHVTDFAVGSLTLKCPSGGVSHRSFMSVYSLAVHPHATFGGDVFFTNGEAGNITGKFPATPQATGTLAYFGRDDCSYHGLSWSAHRVATHVLGPLNFG